MAAAVVADSDAEPEPTESEFEPDEETQAETEVCASCSTASGICVIPVHCLHGPLLNFGHMQLSDCSGLRQQGQ